MRTVNALRATGRAWQVLGCMVLCWVAWSGSATAAPPAKAKPLKETPNQSAARGLLERGRSELKAGHPDQALSSFQAARQLDDSLTAAAEAVADAKLALGKAADARAGYAAALDQRRATLAPDALNAAQAKLDTLTAATAQLQLNIAVEGVEVRVDGVNVGRSPLAQPLLLDPGTHEIQLLKPAS